MARIEALANKDLLGWARLSSGLQLADAARKIGVSQTRLEEWEEGISRPTFNQLRKMATVYKRPVAVFFLSAVPTDFQPLRDFRRLPGAAPVRESPELIYEIRRARERRELALELFESSEEGEPPALVGSAALSDDPEALALSVRQWLGVTDQHQMGWAPGYEAFGGWRRALERSGVLVFQAIDVPVTEMRGFSIYEAHLPAIIVNIKDSIRGRTFSLLHEFIHLLLREAGICMLQEGATIDDAQRIEVFCNRVAGAVLVPRTQILTHARVANHTGSQWSDPDLAALASRFGVSREVVLRRLLILGRTTDDFYQQRRQEFEEEYAITAAQAGGFAPPHRMAISASGPLFVRLVLANYHRDSITASDVADLLGIRLKHLGRIEAELPVGT